MSLRDGDDDGETARLVEAVGGLEWAMTGIAATLEVHGRVLERLLEAAEREPGEKPQAHAVLAVMVGRLGEQNALLGQVVGELARLGAGVEAALQGGQAAGGAGGGLGVKPRGPGSR